MNVICCKSKAYLADMICPLKFLIYLSKFNISELVVELSGHLRIFIWFKDLHLEFKERHLSFKERHLSYQLTFLALEVQIVNERHNGLRAPHFD